MHSQLNHSCEPNVSVRHLPGRTGVRPATRITVVANREIKKGEELVISYLDASGDPNNTPSVRRRRMTLWRDYMFGPCDCNRCQEEFKAMPDAERKALEDELKSGDWKRDAEAEAAVEQRKLEMQEYQERAAEQQQAQGQEQQQAVDTQETAPASQNGQRALPGLADEVKEALGY